MWLLISFLGPMILSNQKICSKDTSGRVILSAARACLELCKASSTKSWRGSRIPLIQYHFCALAERQNELKNSSTNFLEPFFSVGNNN